VRWCGSECGVNSPPWPPFTPGLFFFKFLKLVHWHVSQYGSRFAALAAFHSQGCFFQIPEVGALVSIPIGGVNSPPWPPFTPGLFFFKQPGSFFSNSSSWCSGLGCRETTAAASSTALIRSVVSFRCKESSVKNIIQGECTLDSG